VLTLARGLKASATTTKPKTLFIIMLEQKHGMFGKNAMNFRKIIKEKLLSLFLQLDLATAFRALCSK